MSNYKARSDYFKSIAIKSKLIAHDEDIVSGGKRKSFHRANNDEEFDAACTNWAHFPCVCHIGNSIRYKKYQTGLPKKSIVTTLYFLAKLNLSTYAYEADAIEAAYQQAENVMDKFIANMQEDVEENGSNGDLFLFDLNNASANMIGPFNQTLYGWSLSFTDDTSGSEFKYILNDWKP